MATANSIMSFNPIKDYTIQEKQSDFSWLNIGTTIEPEFNFETGKTYRIVTNYNNQLGSIVSEEFTIDSPPILGQSLLNDLAYSSYSSQIILASNPPSLFYTFFSNEIINDEFLAEGNQSTIATETIELISTPPNLFYNLISSEVIDDGFINEGKQTTKATERITPIPTIPSPFYTT